jgi:hypothetical protein
LDGRVRDFWNHDMVPICVLVGEFGEDGWLLEDGESRWRGTDYKRWNALGKNERRRNKQRSTVVVSEIELVVEDGIYLEVSLVSGGVIERHWRHA